MRQLKYTNCFLISIIGFYLLLTIIFWLKEQEERNLLSSQKMERLEGEYLVALNGYRILADFVFDHLINTPAVLEIMAAAHDNPQDRSALRRRLLRDLSPFYGQLATLHFRQLHFHLADSRSFLRFHRPEKFGDSLVGIRETVVAANRDKQRIRAFEEGRIINGYRFVYPLFQDERHVGSVEISISFAALIAELSRLFGKHYHFLLAREVVEEKVFVDERRNYSPSLLSPRLFHDREVQADTLAGTVMISAEKAQQLTGKVARRFAAEIADWQPVVLVEREDAMAYVVCLLPITNFKGESVAYLISFEGDRASGIFVGKFALIFVLLTLLFAGLLAFFLHLDRTGRRLETLSATDFLTGIYNRGKGYEVLCREHQRALRYGSRYCLIMFDIDHFKRINDSHGHPVGDDVLRQVAKLVRGGSRKSDTFCRWGGEEFLLLLPETSLEKAVLLADKIRCLIHQSSFDGVAPVTISLGVTECVGNTVPVDDVLWRVDQALYQAKQSGRNRVCHLAAPTTDKGQAAEGAMALPGAGRHGKV